MRLPCLFQPRILRTALKSLFGRPYTTAFPATDFVPDERFRGRPRFNAQACMGCGACAQVCPSKCIDLTDDRTAEPPRRRLVQHFDACIGCGQCERYCPTEAGIRLTNEYNNLGFSAADFEECCEKELLLCEQCGEVLAPTDQIRWLVARLGPLAFSNPSLLLMSHRDLGLVSDTVRIEADDTVRGERLRIHCPKCRRRTALKA